MAHFLVRAPGASIGAAIFYTFHFYLRDIVIAPSASTPEIGINDPDLEPGPLPYTPTPGNAVALE